MLEIRELYSDIIKDHSRSKHNKHHLMRADVTTSGKNPSCGDEIELELELKEGLIADASYTGDGCAISQASVSLMIDLVRGKTPGEARRLANIFLGMIRREALTEDELNMLEDAAALKNVSDMPARVKCATMPWHTLITALDECRQP